MANYTMGQLRGLAKVAVMNQNAIKASKLVLTEVAQIHESLFAVMKDDFMKSYVCPQLEKFVDVFAAHNIIYQEKDKDKRQEKIIDAQKYAYCVDYDAFMPLVKATIKVNISGYLAKQFKYVIDNNLRTQLTEYCSKQSSDTCQNTVDLEDTDCLVYCGNDFIDYTLSLLG